MQRCYGPHLGVPSVTRSALAIVCTSRFQAASSLPQPPMRLRFPPTCTPSMRYFSASRFRTDWWRLRQLCEEDVTVRCHQHWYVNTHYQIMLSREKNTCCTGSSHPGTHGGARPSIRSMVLQHRRGKYNSNGGSSPVASRQMECSSKLDMRGQLNGSRYSHMMSVASSDTIPPTVDVQLPSTTQPRGSISSALRTAMENSSRGR